MTSRGEANNAPFELPSADPPDPDVVEKPTKSFVKEKRPDGKGKGRNNHADKKGPGNGRRHLFLGGNPMVRFVLSYFTMGVTLYPNGLVSFSFANVLNRHH